MRPFVGDSITTEKLELMINKAYSTFNHKDITPLKPIRKNEYLLELFHGPTLAFKDVALQLLGLLFDHILQKRHHRLTIIGATSGDTGSAAIEACRDKSTVDVFI